MPTMLADTYAAFIAAGAPPEAAQKAAEEIAAYDGNFAALDHRMERFEGRLTLVQWQLGVLIAGVAALVIKTFA